MNLYDRIFNKGILLKTISHWIVEDFFEPEELDIVCRYFPTSEQICKSLRKDFLFLVNNDNSSVTRD